MTPAGVLPPAAPRPKTFCFTTELEWLSGRSALLRGDGKLEFRVAPPPEFRGEAHVWSPEHLFIASVDTCLLLTFTDLAEKQGLRISSYCSEAEATVEWVDESFRFTSLLLRPAITVRTEADVALAQELLDRAHATCLVANSLRTAVTVEANIRRQY
ncbi:MAG TPA: OsmC family protein [Thermoanaerobaculia bacterium]|nr:OsmC family protein [Thermoanaerobaculia bacterium]